MRAAVWYGPRDVQVTEVDLPRLGRGEVTVQVAYCGICGSDLHEYTSGPHAIPVAEPHPASGVTAPLVMGHEFSGTVVEPGPGVCGFPPGTKVAVEPNYRCGTCPRCVAGEYNVCRHFGFAGLMGHGGLAEYVNVPAYMLHALPDGFPMDQAAVLEPAAVALHSLRRSGLSPEETVLVVGLGPVGLLTVLLAAQRGVRRIIATDLNPKRLDLAGRLGATDVLDARQPDLPGVTRALTGGEGVDVAFEVVGTQATVRTCLAATRRGGRMVLVGLGGELRVDGFALVNDEQSIISSVGYRDCHPELIGLVSAGAIDFGPLITSVIPLQNVVTSGFEALAEGTDQIKVLTRPSGETL